MKFDHGTVQSVAFHPVNLVKFQLDMCLTICSLSATTSCSHIFSREADRNHFPAQAGPFSPHFWSSHNHIILKNYENSNICAIQQLLLQAEKRDAGMLLSDSEAINLVQTVNAKQATLLRLTIHDYDDYFMRGGGVEPLTRNETSQGMIL